MAPIFPNWLLLKNVRLLAHPVQLPGMLWVAPSAPPTKHTIVILSQTFGSCPASRIFIAVGMDRQPLFWPRLGLLRRYLTLVQAFLSGIGNGS